MCIFLVHANTQSTNEHFSNIYIHTHTHTHTHQTMSKWSRTKDFQSVSMRSILMRKHTQTHYTTHLTHVHKYIRTHTHTPDEVEMMKRMYFYTFTYIHIYICMHTWGRKDETCVSLHTHTHTHTHRWGRNDETLRGSRKREHAQYPHAHGVRQRVRTRFCRKHRSRCSSDGKLARNQQCECQHE